MRYLEPEGLGRFNTTHCRTIQQSIDSRGDIWLLLDARRRVNGAVVDRDCGGRDKSINAPVGPLGLASLKIATEGVESTNDGYLKVTEAIQDLTVARDAIAGAMIAVLEGAAFTNKPVNEQVAEQLILAAEELLERIR